MSACHWPVRCLALVAVAIAGCGRPAGEAPSAAPQESPATRATTYKSNVTPVEDDAWRGLERHEIQLDQKLLVVKGSKGVIGCPYLSAASFEKFGEACAIIPAVDTAGMLKSKVTAVTPKAKELGIEVGMPGREALDKIR